MCVIGQIIEYEDFDNQTGGDQVDEYEYEEEDDRYGPAEREGELSLSAEVRADDTCQPSSVWFLIHICFLSASFLLFFLEFARKRSKRGAGIFRAGEKKTLTHDCRLF